MVTTRAFLGSLSRTVIAHPVLIPSAISLYFSSRNRQGSVISRLLPSGRYLRFRIYTQYGNEDVSKEQLRDDIYHYLIWVKASRS